MTVQMKALRPFVYAGKRLKVGEVFAAAGSMRPGSQPALLKAIGNAERYETTNVAAPVAAAYQTRAMAAAPVAPVVHTRVDTGAPDLDSMGKDELHELAARLSVKVHPLAGAAKVRAAIREARSE